MSVEAVRLPGFPPIGPAECRGAECEADVSKKDRKDKIKTWHSALEEGQEETRQYLAKFNANAKHGTDCRFRNLPPSVHLWARKCRRGIDDLKKEAELLEKKGYDLS